MNYKEALEAIEKIEGGADILTAIKTETARLNAEAKKNRESGDKQTKKVTEILAALGLDDGEDAVEGVKGLKTTLDEYKQSGKSPSDVAKELARLSADLGKLNKQLNEANAKAEAEKTKRISALKHSKIVDALSKGNALSPENFAKLLDENVIVDDNDNISYKSGDNTVTLDEGVKSWLAENTWAVKVNGAQGGGAKGTGGSGDAFLDGFDSVK